MDRTQDEPSHRAAVDAWIERSLDHDSSVEIVGLFRGALEVLWSCAVTTLGTVTLTAIAERVLHTATSQYGFLAAINPRPNGDAQWKQHLHERLASTPRAELIAGLRCGLIEFLTVIGRLTAEILSEDLHAALRKITAIPPEASPPADPHDVSRAVTPKVLS